MGRLAKSIQDMAEFCPDLVYRSDAMTEGGWWSGEVRPFRTLSNLVELLDDIHHHRPIYNAWRGELRHLATCQAQHDLHDWMQQISPDQLVRPFMIHLYYGGGPEDPGCWVDGIDCSNGLHMWKDGSICPFLSSKAAWDWTRDTVADFIGHVSIWLVSWMIFRQTGVWIVGEHDGSPGYHYTSIPPKDHCWCRSGKKYYKCHRETDKALFLRFGR